MMLNQLAPNHFNKSDVWKYELKPLGEFDLTPKYEINPMEYLVEGYYWFDWKSIIMLRDGKIIYKVVI